MSYDTVLVFGGDTDPGLRLTQRAVAAGYKVLSLLRGPRELDYITRAGATSMLCDMTDRAAVARAFAGRDGAACAVVAILGGSPQMNTQGNINVIDAAVAAGVRRFVLTSSIGCGDSAAAVDPFVKAIAGRALRAKEWAENRLRGTDLDWTIVRAGGTTRRPGTGTAILTASNTVSGYISLTDLGEMLFLALQSPRAIHQALAAVDSARAVNIDGSPLAPAEL
ncbi:MAG: NAD(P)H-binding protein [Gammaproteobacteria bacterium]|nr:MAG: NAD(P)H-binding protein [Gammaproteobacteria bacterium]